MFHRGQDVRVHWWYRPDSYDEFVSASVAPLDLDDDKPNNKGARVPVSPVLNKGCMLVGFGGVVAVCLSIAAQAQGRGSCMRGGWWTRTSTTSG